MGDTSVLYDYIEGTGTIVPDTSTLLSEVTSEYTDVFGNDLITTPDSPAGVIIAAEVLARTAVVNNNAAIANQINPNIAGGVNLDAIGLLTGIQRNPARKTVVSNVSLTGVAGTVIPEGSQARTAVGDVFATLSTVTLAVDGTAKVNFASVLTGAIPCAGDALVFIVSNILGWETVDNDPASTPASTTTLGAATQSDQAFRAYRNNTLAFQGVSLAEAITSALYAVEGVTSLWFQENVASTTENINGISMSSKSIYVCVNGGADSDVASALLENKSSGCAWNGSTTVSVVEPASGQTYSVSFDRPTQVGILIRVTTPNGSTPNIIQAILDYANGAINGLKGFVVGADVSPFEISGAIMAEYPQYIINQVEISLSTGSPSYTTDVIPIGVNEIAQTQVSYITVVIA